MSILTPPQATRNLEQDQGKIRSPLAQLRKYIHSYVSLEGLALVGLFLALWFWIGLLLDYGVFKLTLIDWVETLPWTFRAVLLALLILALLALLTTRVLVRLLKEFSDAAMALVLEKKFPDQLGDRLITAVELSDPQQAAKWGYSPALVKETIHEAAERIGQVPIRQVFDWKRLRQQGLKVALLTLGLGLLVGAGFCATRSFQGESNTLAGYEDFAEVAGIWTERNILLRNTIWPRRSYLEVLPWERSSDPDARREAGVSQEKGRNLDPYELRIPQGTIPPSLRVRAWKYVVADPKSEIGWRLLTWQDLLTRPEFKANVSSLSLPENWTARDPRLGLTVDEIELYLDSFVVQKREDRWMAQDASGEWQELMWADLTKERLAGLEVPGIPGAWDPKALPAAALSAGLVKGDPLAAAARALLGPRFISLSVTEIQKKLAQAENTTPNDAAHAPIRKVLDRLQTYDVLRQTLSGIDELTADRAMKRTLRKLIVPDTVTLTYKGLRTTSTSSMTRIAGNEFTGNFSELKESVTFTVRGEDYITQPRTITVVERPRVESLESEEERPAYLYYRTSGDVLASDLHRKRQPLEPMKLSVTGETTTLDIPAGTYVTLRATISKPLKSFAISVETKDQKNYRGEKPIQLDERTFQVVLPDIRREQRFKLIFEDTDEVVGERKVVIQPKDDVNPRVREFNPDEIIRRGRGNEGYIIAVGCRIPFKGRIADDHGLARVRYACRVIPADFLSEQKLRALFGVGAVPLFGPHSGGPLLSTAYWMMLNKEINESKNEEAGPEQYLDLPAFVQAMVSHRPGDGEEEILGRDTLLARLSKKQREPYRKLFREFSLTPDRWVEQWAENEEDISVPARWLRANDSRSPLACDLPLWKLTWRDKDGRDKPLKDPDETKAQRRFLIEVRLLAEDTYLDGELDPKTKQPIPHVSPSGETFTFVVVPENELLARIGEEEETRYRELQKAFKPLPENLDRMRDVHFALAGGASGLDESILNSFIARCDSLAEVLKISHQEVRAVYAAYERIMKEMRVNQVSEAIQAKVFKTIYQPLQQVSDTQFDRTYNSLIALRRALDVPKQTVPERVEAAAPKSADARKQLNDLVAQLNSILAAMEGLSTLNALIAELAQIEKKEEDLEGLISRLLRERIRQALEDTDK